mgnify:CR=1 FL=1
MPLISVNRSFVRIGIKRLLSGARMGISALMKIAGIDSAAFSSSRVAFGLVPRINAAGRMQTASRALQLLLAEDSAEAEIMHREEIQTVRTAVNSLEPRERQIIILRYGLDGNPEMTQKDVADFLGISQSYISRLEKKIISRLRREIGKIG